MSKHCRPDWPLYFLMIANTVGVRGECVRSRVGAVIVRDNRIVATGYNGVDAGQPSCLDGLCPRATRPERHLPYDEDGPGRCIARHAEENAVADALDRGLDVEGTTVYVTREPCERCARLLAEHGMTAVWPRLDDVTDVTIVTSVPGRPYPARPTAGP